MKHIKWTRLPKNFPSFLLCLSLLKKAIKTKDLENYYFYSCLWHPQLSKSYIKVQGVSLPSAKKSYSVFHNFCWFRVENHIIFWPCFRVTFDEYVYEEEWQACRIQPKYSTRIHIIFHVKNHIIFPICSSKRGEIWVKRPSLLLTLRLLYSDCP